MIGTAPRALIFVGRVRARGSGERCARGILIRDQRVAATPSRPVQLRNQLLVGATISTRTVSDLCLCTRNLLAQNHVYNASDRVRTVERGSAVGQHFDSLDGAPRNGR